MRYAHKMMQSKHTQEYVSEVPCSLLVKSCGNCPDTHMLFSVAISWYGGILPGSGGTDFDMTASSL